MAGRRQGLIALLASLWAGLLAIVLELQEAFAHWRSQQTAQTAAQEAEKKKRQRKKKAGEAPQAGGTAPTAKAAASKAGAPPPPAAFSSESSSEEEEEPARPPPPSFGVKGFAGVAEAGWEPAVPKKRASASGQRAAGAAGPSGGYSGASGARSAAAKKPGQERKHGVLRVCDRPGCGEEGRGFRACGRCKKVWYCTPACLASDWDRHQLQCNL